MVKTMSNLDNFLAAVKTERERQDKKWGPDQTHPDVHPEATDAYDAAMFSMCPEESTAKEMNEDDVRAGTVNWAAILMEEVAESIAAAKNDPTNLRTELVQVAAVAAAWVNDLDNRLKQSAGQ